MTGLPKTGKLDLERREAWLTIWLNAPENRNALSTQLTDELIETLEYAKTDKTIRGITLRGRGGVFCAGGDLKSFSAGQNAAKDPRSDFVKMNREAGDLFDLVLSMPQLVVALVEGAAIAGGLGLMCCADIIAVTKDAKFSLTETMIGIAPAQIAPIIVARVGLPKARRLMLTGARFDGTKTPDYGLSDFVVADVEGLERVEREIKSGLLKCAPGAIAITKEILLATPYLDREAQKDFAAEKFADCITSDEGREGIASFIEKRRPSWAPKS